MRAWMCLVGMVVAFALASSTAAASTYCAGVSGADCAVSYPATGAGLKSALGAADTNIDIGGTPDAVRIGPGTYAAAAGFTTTGGDISIVGAGESTILTAADVGGPTDAIVLSVVGGSTAVSVSHLQIRMAGAAQDGGIWNFREISDVHIGGPGTLRDAGILLPSAGGRVTRALIDPAGMYRAAAIIGKSMTVEDTLIRVPGDGGPFETFGVLADGPLAPGSTDVALRHVTILGNGAPNAIGIRMQPTRSSAGTTSASVHLRDSLLHGLGTPLALVGQAADTGSTPCKGNCYDALANGDSHYSSLAVASITRLDPAPTPPAWGISRIPSRCWRPTGPRWLDRRWRTPAIRPAPRPGTPRPISSATPGFGSAAGTSARSSRRSRPYRPRRPVRLHRPARPPLRPARRWSSRASA